MKKLAKILWIIVGVVFVFTILIIWVADDNTEKEVATSQQTEIVQKDWSVMTYEERDNFLNNSIRDRLFSNASDAEIAMRNAIKKEVVNPKTLSFEWSPSVYNGSANVVEADSGWIYITFKCSAKNDLGIEKEIMGSVTYEYVPETNSLNIHKWDINQND